MSLKRICLSKGRVSSLKMCLSKENVFVQISAKFEKRACLYWDDKQHSQAQSDRCKISTDGVTISSIHRSIWNLVSLSPEDSPCTVQMLLFVSMKKVSQQKTCLSMLRICLRKRTCLRKEPLIIHDFEGKNIPCNERIFQQLLLF